MTAVDHPALVRGVVIAAAAAKQYPAQLTVAINVAGDPSKPAEDRLKVLRFAFFAPGNDPSGWLDGWHPEVRDAQRAAVAAVKQSWSGGSAQLLDLQAAQDPFKPPDKRNEMKDEFGDRVTIAVIPNASHALFPGAAAGRRRGAGGVDQDPAAVTSARLRAGAHQRHHLPQQARRDPGMAFDSEMDAVPSVILRRDLRIKHDHKDIARAQPARHGGDIG